MMIYSQEWMEGLLISRTAKRWLESNVIPNTQYDLIKERYRTPLYTPNLFIRIALFIFTSIALGGVFGIVSLIVGFTNEGIVGVTSIVVGVVTLIALEAIIRQRHLYQAGIDDALLYSGLLQIIGGTTVLYFRVAGSSPSNVIPWILVLPVLGWGAVRFGDRLATATAYCCMIAIMVIPLIEGGTTAKSVLPFALMVVAVISFILVQRLKRTKKFLLWDGCLLIVEILSLVLLYSAGNYYAVRTMHESLMEISLAAGEDISFAALFWIFTLTIPILLLARAVFTRSHLLLRLGLMSGVLSILTFRYYYHIVSPEAALTLAGTVLFLIAVYILRLLKHEPNGYTARNLLKEKFKDLDAEGILVSQTLGTTAKPVEEQSFKGEGGGFGGGGSSNRW